MLGWVFNFDGLEASRSTEL